MSLDAAIIGQLQSLKQANPMMGALPRPGQPNPGVPGMPPMVAPGGFPGMPQPMVPQMSQGPPPGTNTSLLSVAVNNLPFRYQLNEADLREMCQRWGQLNAVHIYRDGAREVGVMVFADPIDAADCQRQLNGHTCDFQGPGGPAQGSLAAAIGEPMQLSPPRVQMGAPMAGGPMGAPMAGPPPMAALGMAPVQPGNFAPPQGGQQMMGGMGFQGQPEAANGKGNGKAFGGPGWSVKVVVHAERLHPEFQTVLKICGANNMNLDHIRSQGAATVELRGQRSGTLDARTGQELPEPMYLYMASDTPESGVAALEMVKDLLGSVYDEHQQWCAQNNLQWQHENLQPHVVENPHLTAGF